MPAIMEKIMENWKTVMVHRQFMRDKRTQSAHSSGQKGPAALVGRLN
jgi:hypothetical protein